jgi:hypothetical protein
MGTPFSFTRRTASLLELDAETSMLSGHLASSGLGFARVVRHIGAGSVRDSYPLSEVSMAAGKAVV